VSPAIAEKYNFDIPDYQGVDQIVEIEHTGQRL
jgi:NAD(P)H-hydrate epimerase